MPLGTGFATSHSYYLTDGEGVRSEVGLFLRNPHDVGRMTDLPLDPVPNGFLTAMCRELSRELSAPRIQFLIGHFGPQHPRTKTPDLFFAIGDESDEVIACGNESGLVSVRVHVQKDIRFFGTVNRFLHPTLADLRPLALGGQRADHLVGDCADLEVLPRLAVDVNREPNRLFVREFLREFLELERVKCDHVSIVHGYMIAGFRETSTTFVQFFDFFFASELLRARIMPTLPIFQKIFQLFSENWGGGGLNHSPQFN